MDENREDLRVVRRPGGEEAEPPRRRDRHGQPGHPVRGRGLRPRVGRRRTAEDYRRRLLVAAPLTAAVLALTMLPGVPETSAVRWTGLLLAAPVVAWAGWPFHRAAAVNARHGASTMDTLVSLGTLVAYG